MGKRPAVAMLWTGYALTAVWAMSIRVALGFYPLGEPRPFLLRPFAFSVGLIVANAVTLFFAWKVRGDAPPRTRARTAWLLIAISAAAEIVRYGLLRAAASRLGAPSPGSVPLFPLSAAAGLIATALLLIAFGALWSAFRPLGLGRLGVAHWIGIAAIVATIPVLLKLPAQGAQALGALAPARLPLIVRLQQFDPVLIAGCAIAGIFLVRTGKDAGRGPLAAGFRCVGLFGLVRMAALVVPLIPVSGIQWIEVPATGAGIASDWLITLAVYYRWRLTIESRELTARLAPD
ncbi:MAG: hypothetical protein C5B51_15245 [Terriglobia bacterium]|nr:MAG: hypothetical protein C5B51_15245 [Terriglobia bacterium]